MKRCRNARAECHNDISKVVGNLYRPKRDRKGVGMFGSLLPTESGSIVML